MPETHGWLKELELNRARKKKKKRKRGHMNEMKNAREILYDHASLHSEKEPANTRYVPAARGSFL